MSHHRSAEARSVTGDAPDTAETDVVWLITPAMAGMRPVCETVAAVLPSLGNKYKELCPILGAGWERRDAVRRVQKWPPCPTGCLSRAGTSCSSGFVGLCAQFTPRRSRVSCR